MFQQDHSRCDLAKLTTKLNIYQNIYITAQVAGEDLFLKSSLYKYTGFHFNVTTFIIRKSMHYFPTFHVRES